MIETELEVFVSERLHAAVSEIMGVFKKTLKGYEQQAARLKEENQRNRSLLDMILKAQKGRPIKSTPVVVGPVASDSSTVSKVENIQCSNSGLWCVFSSRNDLLKHASGDNCSYCLKSVPATKTHLIEKHYLNAVHLTDNGTEKCVIPCTCKDFSQGRSHWHCPCCTRIISRRTNFQVHISKQPGYAILQKSQDADRPNVSAFEEVPLTLGSCSEQDKQVSHPKCQDSVQIEGKQMQQSNSILSFVADHASLIVCSNSYTQDLSETLNTVESGKAKPLPNTSNQPLETQPDRGDGGILQPTGESQHHKLCSSVKSSNTKRNMQVKRSFSLKINKSTKLSVSQNLKGPHICKACGNTFHYMYKLKAHTQTHALDKTKICGICGKHLESKESFVKHLHSHTKRNKKQNKSGVCGAKGIADFTDQGV
ncbi:zinc finger protein 133-like [Trematomus bernacchii]|uniref:zinc finger protein 133-like n=1 Tax=Trematomus bernacchii TaxID=40690 RepID=UPI00146F69F8|nr:zinc finger protein 133-like [Trematomus bernacchii]